MALFFCCVFRPGYFACICYLKLPYGKRQHYDHRMMKTIAEKVTENNNAKLYYLDDIPYSVARPEETISVLYEKILNDEDLKYKYKMMGIYESQMCAHYYYMVKTLNRERLFINLNPV